MPDIFFYENDGLLLRPDTRFRFKTFGFPVEAEVVGFGAPSQGKPAEDLFNSELDILNQEYQDWIKRLAKRFWQ